MKRLPTIKRSTQSKTVQYTVVPAAPVLGNAFSAASMVVSSTQVIQQGTYTASASSYAEGQGYVAFNPNANTVFWGSQYLGYGAGSAPAYTQTPYSNGVYVGGGSGALYSTTTTTITAPGEWLQIQLPYYLQLTFYALTPQSVAGRCPTTFYVAGSNNGTTWVVIDSRVGVSAFTTATIFTPPSSASYKYFRFIANAVQTGGTVVNISCWALTGNASATLPISG